MDSSSYSHVVRLPIKDGQELMITTQRDGDVIISARHSDGKYATLLSVEFCLSGGQRSSCTMSALGRIFSLAINLAKYNCFQLEMEFDYIDLLGLETERPYKRFEDMSPSGYLQVFVSPDHTIKLIVFGEGLFGGNKYESLETVIDKTCIWFDCLYLPLLFLMLAIVKDNKAAPQRHE